MDLPQDYLEGMLRGIVAFEASIGTVKGKFKLSQNRSPVDRLNVIAALNDTGNADANRVATLMDETGEV
jgi:transcriptional regulator